MSKKKIISNNNQNVDSQSVESQCGNRCDIETIKQSSRLIFCVSKLFGYSLFKVPKINLKNHKICQKFTIETRFMDFSVFALVVFVHLALIYYNIFYNFNINVSQSIILMGGGQICLVIGLCVATASITLCFIRREKVFKIFINLCYIDIWLETIYDTLVKVPYNRRTVKNPNTDILQPILNHKRHFKFSILFLAIGLILITLDMVATYSLIAEQFDSNIYVYVSYALQNGSFLMISLQTFLFLLVIKTRYAALNNLISCYLRIQDNSTCEQLEELYDIENSSDCKLICNNSTAMRNRLHFDKKVIAEFAQMHDKLNDIVEWINGCYAVQCLGVIAVSFGYVILTFFSTYHALYRPHEDNLKLAAVYVPWFIFYMICVMSLIITSWETTVEGKRTGILLHKSINQIMIDPQLQDDAQYKEIIDSLRIFSVQLQKRSPIISCGLFTLDWTLLFSIISASATYLVILIQFDSSKLMVTCDTN